MAEFIVVCGYVASGKTTVSNALGQATDSKIIRTDDIRKKLFPKEFNHELIDFKSLESVGKIETWIDSNDSGIDFQQLLNPLYPEGELFAEIISKYTPRIKEQKGEVYDRAFAELESALAAGKNVLFDATFSSASMRKRAYQAAIKNGVESVYVVQVVCDEAIVESRLAKRNIGKQTTTSNARQMAVFRVVKEEFDKSQIQNDNPGLAIARIVYDTGTHAISQFGKEDETVKKIKDVLNVLSQKYT